MKTGIELIAEERQEQIEKHGYTVENDCAYRDNVLARAACAIAYSGTGGGVVNMDAPVWAWAIRHRPGIDMVHRLAIAGALIAAEIDRLNTINPEHDHKLTLKMSKEEIEGNILIGGLMGESQSTTGQINFWINIPGKDLRRWINITELKYHTSWDWLMPVCKRIIEMYFDKREHIYEGLAKCDIGLTWRAVVDFLKFWNDNTQEKITWA